MFAKIHRQVHIVFYLHQLPLLIPALQKEDNAINIVALLQEDPGH